MTQIVLELDGTLGMHPGLPRLRFESSVFPGGEPHFRLLDLPERGTEVMLTHRLNSFNDVGLLLVAVDALRRTGAGPIRAFIPYFPAARQDRVMVPGEALTCKVYADLLNGLGLEEVIVFDPHSDVAPALLDRCRTVPNHAFIAKVLDTLEEKPLIVSPDAGALKKVYALSKALGGMEVVECGKSRDVATGALSGFRVHADDLRGRSCLIVDDICDGGGTFIGLAQELQRHGAGALHLAVSHGIFSKGTSDLAKIFTGLFTTDSIRSSGDEGVTRVCLRDIVQL